MSQLTDSNVQQHTLDETSKPNLTPPQNHALSLNSPSLTTKVKHVTQLSLNKYQGVTESSSQDYNSIFGKREEEQRILTEYAEMCRLGGLDGTHSPSVQDLRTARLGLAILAANRNPEICIPALQCLQALIEKDPITSDSSADLIPLLKSLLIQMDRKIQEDRNKEMRTEFAKSFGAITELILNHSACDHLGNITEELKLKLDDALEGLGRLDNKKDLRLTFEIKCACEGIKRFKDDSQIVLDLLRRLFHLSMFVAAYFYDGVMLADEIKKTFCNTHLKVHLKDAWYEEVLFIRQFTKAILAEPSDLGEQQKESMVQSLLAYIDINKKEKKKKWPFYYAAIELLTKIVLQSNNKHLRKMAFEGCAINIEDPKTGIKKPKELKGLIAAAEFNSYRIKKRTISPMSAKYRCVDYNAEIRLLCAENLIKIAQNSPDSYIRERAKNILISRLTCEEAHKVQLLLSSNVPATEEKQQAWLDQKGPTPHNSKQLLLKKSSQRKYTYQKQLNTAGQLPAHREAKKPLEEHATPSKRSLE